MNPADAFRKVQRQKEIQRNKKERQFQRDASKLKANPDEIKGQLQEVLEMQDEGKYNLSLKLKKRALQGEPRIFAVRPATMASLTLDGRVSSAHIACRMVTRNVSVQLRFPQRRK